MVMGIDEVPQNRQTIRYSVTISRNVGCVTIKVHIPVSITRFDGHRIRLAAKPGLWEPSTFL